MRCDKIQELLVEAWAGTITAHDRTRLESHLAGCASCREEQESLTKVWTSLAAIPGAEPGPAIRPRFYAMLQGYQQGMSRGQVAPSYRSGLGEWLVTWFERRPAFLTGFAVVLLAMSFCGGYLVRESGNGHEELAKLRAEVHEMQQMVTISLLKQESASERLKGVSWSSQVNRPDLEFLSTLMHTLNYDPNVDVRLAAVDALSRFAGDPSVRDGLVQSLPKQDSPMVQISLIDLLVQRHEHRSIDVLRQLINDNRQNRQVRQRAQWGLQQLS